MCITEIENLIVTGEWHDTCIHKIELDAFQCLNGSTSWWQDGLFFFGGKFGKMDLGKIVLGQRWCNMSL